MYKLNFLVLSGPTREYIDPVRFISNESSGKMGKALAEEILRRKENLIFITGPSTFLPSIKAFQNNSNREMIKVNTADEMFCALKKNIKKADIIINTAAVCDFKVRKTKKHKIKKSGDNLSISLVKNPDIAAYCGKNKKNQVIAGFALETQNLIKNAKEKLENKNLDLIAANTNESFGKDITTVYILRKNLKAISLKNVSKKEISKRIINESIAIFESIKTDKNNSKRI
ncbi:MAG: hypothetical protein LBQ37_02320 [Elusimicrobiota bacterium]|jgi:phosphopantothenoylcysteine synthetase/decarboxylase|nr:hypothetical protein [Elusimicrobiota bacterium]